MAGPLARAALLGSGAGLRSFAAPAVLAARGRGPFPGPARFIAYGAAAGELIADLQPEMGSRLAVRGLMLRLTFAGLAGRELAGAGGVAAAAGLALGSAWAGSRARSELPAAGAARVAGAVAEDVLAYLLVAAATRR